MHFRLIAAYNPHASEWFFVFLLCDTAKIVFLFVCTYARIYVCLRIWLSVNDKAIGEKCIMERVRDIQREDKTGYVLLFSNKFFKFFRTK